MSMQFPKGGFVQLYFDPLSAPNQVNSMWSWGFNSSGQLGQNDRTYRSSSVQVGALTNWIAISGGASFNFAIKTDGSLWGWGSNASGELGQNNRTNKSSPVQVGALTSWKNVFAGNGLCFAIKNDNSLWGWGANLNGQLGINDAIPRSSPVQIGSLNNWFQISSYNSTVAIKTDGSLWAWGLNTYGQLGQNNLTYRSSPTQIGSDTNWSKAIITVTTTVLALKNTGTIWTWGRNSKGESGLNDTILRSSPTQIGALTTWSVIGGGTSSFYAIKNDGSLWAWGGNGDGQLGQNDLVYRSSPVQIGALTNWYGFFPTEKTGMAWVSKTDGTLWSWGNNLYGGLGQGDIVYRSSPVQLGSLTTWNSVSCTQYSTLALQSA